MDDEPMRWVGETAVGDWAIGGMSEAWNIHHFVPTGFAAYARVLHPATRRRLLTGEWPGEDDDRGWARLDREPHEERAEAVTWSDTALAFGASLAPTSSWGDLVGAYAGASAQDDAGWRYEAPEEGSADARLFSRIAGVLLDQGRESTEVFAGVWEGWSDLVGGMAVGQEGLSARYVGDVTPAHLALLRGSGSDPFNRPYAEARWRSGLLSDEISRGPRFAAPDRDHVLFSGPLALFADEDWPSAVPWCDPQVLPEQSPNVLWPSDRSWFLATDIDADSTLVGGSASLVHALGAADGIEAVALREGDTL